MSKRKGQTTYHTVRLVEYRDFFVGEAPIDVCSTLKLYSRKSLIKTAAILSHHFGNLSVLDNEDVLFSEKSKKHFPYLRRLFNDYYKRTGLSKGQKVELLTYRTSLELWRFIFAIRADEYTNIINEEDFEILLFKVLLTINEKLVSFNERKEKYKHDELLFLNGFLTNEANMYDLQYIMQPQMFYFQQLVDFIPSNKVLTKVAEKLLHDWGVDNWLQYFNTILSLAYDTDQYIKKHANGVPTIPSDWMANNPGKGLVSLSLIEHLYIEEDEYIPYKDEDVPQKELNVDYRRFRSHPFVKLKDGTGYIVINNQLLCERLFNSLYFDFLPLINGSRESLGYFDYNKGFIEKVLFRNTIFKCIPNNYFTFPSRGNGEKGEKPKEPDFYARSNRGELIIVECKAIKMNGECRDDGDYARLLDELHEKIVLKTKNLDKNRKEFKGTPEPIGVGQLVRHIDSIESDTFEWDTQIPDVVCYYPLLVFEDVKLVQRGILSMVNRWFYEELKKENDMEITEAIMPIMVVSINTLYLYDNLLHKRGLVYFIDSFIKENAKYDPDSGMYSIAEDADFDDYLRRNPFKKSEDAVSWLKKMMNKR